MYSVLMQEMSHQYYEISVRNNSNRTEQDHSDIHWLFQQIHLIIFKSHQLFV